MINSGRLSLLGVVFFLFVHRACSSEALRRRVARCGLRVTDCGLCFKSSEVQSILPSVEKLPMAGNAFIQSFIHSVNQSSNHFVMLS